MAFSTKQVKKGEIASGIFLFVLMLAKVHETHK